MKYALIFPPEYDGELHINVKELPGVVPALRIDLIISVEGNDTIPQTLRKLGKQLYNQPLRKRGDSK